MHVYPGANHVFNLPYSPNYSAEAAKDSSRTTPRSARTVGDLRDWARLIAIAESDSITVINARQAVTGGVQIDTASTSPTSAR